MHFLNGISAFPKYVRQFIFFFTLALAFGYFSGFKFLMGNTDLSSSGVEAHYNGNEDDETAETMIFKKTENEILTTIHGHAVSFSLIFLALGSIVLTLPIKRKLKRFLLIEPFLSIILTFGGIWLLWKEITWFKYVIMVSGTLLTVTFLISIVLIFWFTLKNQAISSDID
jgi:hypothetical protein